MSTNICTSLICCVTYSYVVLSAGPVNKNGGVINRLTPVGVKEGSINQFTYLQVQVNSQFYINLITILVDEMQGQTKRVSSDSTIFYYMFIV